jgi:hypothetical protein
MFPTPLSSSPLDFCTSLAGGEKMSFCYKVLACAADAAPACGLATEGDVRCWKSHAPMLQGCTPSALPSAVLEMATVVAINGGR